MRHLQHFIVIRIDREIRMHVTVAGMHMQRDKHTTLEHAIMDRLQLGHHRREIIAAKKAL